MIQPRRDGKEMCVTDEKDKGRKEVVLTGSPNGVPLVNGSLGFSGGGPGVTLVERCSCLFLSLEFLCC